MFSLFTRRELRQGKKDLTYLFFAQPFTFKRKKECILYFKNIKYRDPNVINPLTHIYKTLPYILLQNLSDFTVSTYRFFSLNRFDFSASISLREMGMEMEIQLKTDSSINGDLLPEKINERVEEENLKRFSTENISSPENLSPNSNSNIRGGNDVVHNNNVISAPEPEACDNKEEGRASEDVDQESMDKTNGGDARIIQPHSELPKPEAPPGILPSPPRSLQNSFTIGKYLRERSNNFSIAIAKKLNFIKENVDNDAWFETDRTVKSDEVTQFNISGLKVIVKLKSELAEEDEGHKLKGRVSFFSRSNCRDCTAVRTFFRQKGLKFVEINIDVYPQREKELIQRTGSSQVPQIFFNEKLFGGLVALNSLRNSGTFDQRFREMLGKKCSSGAPAPPVYGFDDHDQEEPLDEMFGIIKVLRQRLPIQDRLMKMKIVKNCFSGSEMVEVIIQHLDCGRKKVRSLQFFILYFSYYYLLFIM